MSDIQRIGVTRRWSDAVVHNHVAHFVEVADDPSAVTATCEYGTTVNAAFRIGPVAAVQFHPEKSAESGLALLGNFVGQVARGSTTVAATS